MDLSEEIMEETEEASSKLIPERSRGRYEKELTAFNEWREKNVVSEVLNETIMLEYVSSLSKNFKASSLWTKFSMLKKALIVNGNTDISRFEKVMAFMKSQTVNYIPKKSNVLSIDNCCKFILEASDELFLLCKVVLIFGLYGACRRDELLRLIVDDIEDHEKYALVKLQDIKTHTSRSFIIPDSNQSLNPYEIYKKYAKLRPRNVGIKRFFLGYRKGKCIAQPAGMHIIGGVPRKVAEFLGLEHPENYTGHSLRRSGASMVAESSGNLPPVTIKSSKVTKGYIEQSKVTNMIISTTSSNFQPVSNQIKPFYFTTSDFTKIVKSPGFVDKTLLLKPLLNGELMILITAPRRFGKSTNMDMVKTFIEIQVDNNGVIIDREKSPNRRIFKDNNLLVFQDKKFFDEHFATYPVIHVSFKCVFGNSFDEVLEMFKVALHEAFKQHIYLLTSNKLKNGEKKVFEKFCDVELYGNLLKRDIVIGLKFLSEFLYKHYDNKKVFVLIDEYDAPINDTMFKKNIDIDEVNEFLCSIFSQTLKQNKFVERALLTGVSYFASVGLSGANNIEKYMFLTKHDFVTYYGVTEDEVTGLLIKFKVDSETGEKVKLHYNGYVSLTGIKLFSIWSILHFLQKREVKSYWEDSGVMTNLEEALNLPVVRCCIEALCLGKSVDTKIIRTIGIRDIIHLKKLCLQQVNLETDELIQLDIYLNFLLQQGYLTIERQVTDQLYAVRLPNAEIFRQFREKLLNYYGVSINCCIENCAVSFDKISSSFEDETFIDFLSNFNNLLETLKTKFSRRNEDLYYCIMFFILCKTKFAFVSEFSILGGRVDLIVCADNLGIIIELKYKESSEEALNQIKTKYLNGFNENSCFKNVTRNICIGVNIDENNVADMSVFVNSANLSKDKRFEFKM